MNSTKLIESSLNDLIQSSHHDASGDNVVCFNSNQWDFSGVVAVDSKNAGFTQVSNVDGKGLVWAHSEGMSLSSTKLNVKLPNQVSINQVNELFVLENEFISASFDKHGRLTSLFDKIEHRELVPKDSFGNVFRYYEDIPIFWDGKEVY